MRLVKRKNILPKDVLPHCGMVTSVIQTFTDKVTFQTVKRQSDRKEKWAIVQTVNITGKRRMKTTYQMKRSIKEELKTTADIWKK